MAFISCPHCGQHHVDSLTLCPNTGRALTVADGRSASGGVRVPEPRPSSRPGYAPTRTPASLPPPPAPGTRVPVLPSADEESLGGGAMGRLLGRTLGGRYRIRAVLGEGGMGTVFEAEHLTLGRVVAIKVLHPSQARRSVSVVRFQKEARAAGTIGHPNICEVYDLGELEDGSPYLVMERLVGETLSDRISREGTLPVEDVVDVMLQVLSGLHAAHGKGILHRDIKPENIFLNARMGVGPLAKILDFGVAKEMGSRTVPLPPILEPHDDALELTMTGMVMGTPFYLSPEQARGDRDLDQRTDLYACGVVIYESLTGERPFAAANYNTLLRAILTTDPPSLRSLRPDLPSGFEHVVARAMARSREHRFGSALEMLEAIAPYHASNLASVRPLPHPSSSGHLSSPPVRRSVPPPPPPSMPPAPSSAREWDDNTVYDAPLQQRMERGPWQEADGETAPSDGGLEHSGARSSGLDLDFDEETVRTTAPSEIAKRMREQIKRTKK